MREDELFAAYRTEAGTYGAECDCGGYVESSLGTERAVAAALVAHYASAPHQQWSEWQEAVHALQRPARRKCPCHSHQSVPT